MAKRKRKPQSVLWVSYRTASGKKVSRRLTCRMARGVLRNLSKKDPRQVVCVDDGVYQRCSHASTMFRQVKKTGYGPCRRLGYWRK